MASRSRSASPRRPCALPASVESHSQQAFWVRLEKFADSRIDGDGHTILDPSSVLVDVRAKVPELEFVMSSLKEDVGSVDVTKRLHVGIASVRLHEAVHSSLVKELKTNPALRESGVQLAEFRCLGRGFRAREIERLLRECFVALHSHFSQ